MVKLAEQPEVRELLVKAEKNGYICSDELEEALLLSSFEPDDLDEFKEEALDAIEYANGSTSTTW